MRLEDMRRSANVEDLRGLTVGRTGAGVGIGTVVLVIAGYFLGISPSTMLGLLSAGGAATQDSATSSSSVPLGTPKDPQGDFAAAVLGETEDVWSKYFAAQGQRLCAPDPGTVHGRGRVGVRNGERRSRTVLLPRRSAGVYRPRLF